MSTANPKQKLLSFDSERERARLERIERLLGTTPKTTTAARLFDEAAYREATAIARGSKQSTEVKSL